MESFKGVFMKGTSHMAKEISSQPKMWQDTYESILANKNQIATFLNKI